jgi:hypothetical protein
VFQAPARDSSRVRCHGHVANVLASILIFSYISSLFTCGHVSPDEEIEYKKKKRNNRHVRSAEFRNSHTPQPERAASLATHGLKLEKNSTSLAL